MAKGIKIKTRDIAIAAIFLSLILIFVLVPMPNFLGVSMAFIPLLAVILAANVQGLGMGLFTGAAFGFASLINAFINPTLMAPMFYNPLVSIVPRVVIPVTTYFTFKGMKHILGKRSDEAGTFIAATISSIVAVCTNTGLVLSMMAAFNFGKTFGSTVINAAFFGGLLGLNFLFEISICAFIAPIITVALRVALGLDKRDRKVVDAELRVALGLDQGSEIADADSAMKTDSTEEETDRSAMSVEEDETVEKSEISDIIDEKSEENEKD